MGPEAVVLYDQAEVSVKMDDYIECIFDQFHEICALLLIAPIEPWKTPA